MDTVSFDPTSLGIATLVQFVWGIAVKRVPALAPWPNKLIPIFNMILGSAIGWLTTLAAPPAHAQGVGAAGAAVATVLNNPVIISYLGMVISTAHHSILKNTWQWLKTILNRGATAQ